MTQVLQALIDDLRAKRASWEVIWEADCNSAGESIEWAAYEAAEMAVIQHRCSTFGELSEKARFLLGNESTLDTLMNCTFDGDRGIKFLLRSMIVDNEEQPA